MQRYRARKRVGLQVIQVEIGGAHVDRLIETGLLKEDQRQDRGEIGETVQFVLNALALGCVTIDHVKLAAEVARRKTTH